MLHQHLKYKTEYECCSCFNQIFYMQKLTDDSNKGLIVASELRRILMNTGEKLSHKEGLLLFLNVW